MLAENQALLISFRKQMLNILIILLQLVEKRCPPAQNISHGFVEAPSLTLGSIATYSCGVGYRLEGESTAVCQHDETWTPPPRCVGKS